MRRPLAAEDPEMLHRLLSRTARGPCAAPAADRGHASYDLGRVSGIGLGAGFAVALLVVAAFCWLAAVLYLVLYDYERRGAMSAAVATLGLLLAGLGVWQWRRPLRDELVPHAAGAVAVVSTLSCALQVVLSQDPAQASFLMLIVMISGAVLTSSRWLVAVDLVAALGYLSVAAPRSGDPGWRHFGLSLLFAVTFAHVVHHLHRRGQQQLALLAEVLQDQALRDPLTGLLNRRGLTTRAAGLSGVDSGGALLGAVCLDVDGFKAINDELGHAAGDAVLVEIADRLRGLAGPRAALARTGGDEFVVVLPVDDAGALDRLAHRVRIRLTGTAGVLALPWVVSVGTAVRRVPAGPGDGVEALLRTADLAMYEDKQSGGRARGAALDPAS